MAQAGAADATRLREWDDLAKSEGLATPSLDHYLVVAQSCALR
jgi:predicted HD phosphohydrolase